MSLVFLAMAAAAPCAALERPLKFDQLAPVTAATEAKVEIYRKKWRVFCDTRQGLADLFEEANALAPLLEKELLGRDFTGNAKIMTLVTETYPGFIPGFEASAHEYTYFRPSEELFAEAAKRGETKDREFWSLYSQLSPGPLPAWFEQTSDIAMCVRFGSFDWKQGLADLARLKTESWPKPYGGLVKRVDDMMLSTVNSFEAGAICTCGKIEAVPPGLDQIAQHAAPEVKKVASRIQKKLEQKQIKVLSHAVNACGEAGSP